MNTELQTKARKLYFQSTLSKTEIATALGIPRRTLHHWIKEQNWEYQKQCASHMPVMIAEKCYNVLNHYADMLLAPERAGTLLSHKEADTIHKMTVSIGKLKTAATLNESMEMFSHFLASVNRSSPEMAKAIMPLVSGYVATAASNSVSVPLQYDIPATAAELETERQLDLECEAEDADMQTPPTQPAKPVQPQHNPVSVADKHELVRERRQSPPPYQELLDDLRRQDENLRHMYPTPAKPARLAAA